MIFETVRMFVLLAAVQFGTLEKYGRDRTRDCRFAFLGGNLDVKTSQWVDETLRFAGVAADESAAVHG